MTNYMTHNMNINTVLDELKNYDIREYQLADLIKQAVRHDVSDLHKVYANDNDLQITSTITTSVTATLNHMVEVYGSMPDARLYKFMENTFRHVRYYPEKSNQFKVFDYSMINFIDLMQYAISGDQSQDLKIAYDVKDKNPAIDDRGTIFDITHPDYPDVVLTAKTFKNGSVKVTGLTEEHTNRLNHAFKFYEDKGYNLGSR